MTITEPSTSRLNWFVRDYLTRLQATIANLPIDRIESIGDILTGAYRHRKQVFIVGNGGSAATASHLACDLGKNTIAPNRPRFRVMSLNDNVPLLSALANDSGYDRVFSEQLTNLIRPGDVLLSITGSGNSPNILRAMRLARAQGATNVALLGFDGGVALSLADQYVLVPCHDYGIIEDLHLVLGHILTAYFTERVERGTAAVR
jgi:D-sedoheptulose 7-phosphate isomerase